MKQKQTRPTEMLAHFTAPMPSVRGRMAAGKALREKVPHACTRNSGPHRTERTR